MNPKVAVITRTKNRSTLLKRALLSVASQSYSDYIHVIVNDGGESKDLASSLECLTPEQRKKVITIDLPTSKGMEAASNIGIKHCNTEFIVIHDDDDSWQVDFLDKTVSFLEEHPLSMGVVTHNFLVYEHIAQETVIIESSFLGFHQSNISFFEMCSSNVFPPIAFLFRRHVLEEIGIFNEELPVLGDWDFNLRFLQKYEIDVITIPLANYHHRTKSNRTNGNSVTVNIDSHKHYRNIIHNQYLRKGLSENRIDLGFLLNIAPMLVKHPYENKKSIYKKYMQKIKLLMKSDDHAKKLQKKFHGI